MIFIVVAVALVVIFHVRRSPQGAPRVIDLTCLVERKRR